MDGRYGRVSLAFVGHSVQLRFGCVRQFLNFFFHVVTHVLQATKFEVSVIWASYMYGDFPKVV